MAEFEFTPQQKQAIETIDRSVLVTAAAGSGKTAVLAARCAYLVCDAPPDARCSVEDLLVVTFTEAAAAEMRSRIQTAIRERLADRPHDGYLRAQLALTDTAQISTIHAFCLWIVRRWFNLIDVDPSAAVLDEDEARLLQTETIEHLFSELYEEGLGERFRRLVEMYGLGKDTEIAALVQKLARFCESLPDPDAWLRRAVERVSAPAGGTMDELGRRLLEELALQQTECEQLAAFVTSQLAPGAFYGQRIGEYAAQLRTWHERLSLVPDRGPVVSGRGLPDSDFDAVQAQINEYTLSSRGAPRLGKDAPDDVAAMRDQARDIFQQVHEKLFKGRLRRRFGRFSRTESAAGLQAVAPYVTTLVELVRAFRQRYAEAKQAIGGLDFADLERYAYALLTRRQGEVAQVLRHRFAHVLVDEFQDISPLQEAILREVSREPDPDRRGNLFAVGDVKQSIYRFRLAEPRVLLDRERAFAADASRGCCVRLQMNYRSRRGVIDGVNLLFRRLMRREIGGIDYDDQAELRRGRTDAAAGEPSPIEVHLLERRPEREEPEPPERPRFVDPADPTQRTAIEREAYLIGTRIRELVPAGEATGDKHAISHGDIVILLRAASHTAGPMADMLQRMGIPAYAEAAGEFFDAVEIRDVLALLDVLDNLQQDIPLAAVLRSGVLGIGFSEDDLVSVRVINREVPFHDAVRLYAEQGGDEPLRERVADLIRTIERYRSDIRQRPLADVLWQIYQDTGYLAYVGGLEGGAQRRANLLKLHERARQFGTFQRQGLHRFLRFIDSLRDQERDIGTAPAMGEADNVVRIMTIHRSKGLEFPVVFVADLGRRFNLSDAAGRMIFDRDAGIGLKIVDCDRMLEYPSAVHHLVADQIHTSTQAEELRVLYVAMTRARDRLVLLGSTDLNGVERARQRWQTHGADVSPLTLLSAGTPLDWLIPALAAAPAGEVEWAGDTPHSVSSGPTIRVRLHAERDMADWRLEESATRSEDSTLSAAARLEPLPEDEPVGQFAEQADEVVARLDFAYPHLAAASVRAVVAASELKRPFDVLQDPDEQPRGRFAETPTFEIPSLSGPDRPASEAGDTTLPPVTASPAWRGTATHTLLQYLRLDETDDAAAIAAQARRLTTEGVLTVEEADAIDLDAVAWFFSTELGRRVRRAGDAFRREVMFLALEPAQTFDRTVADACDVPVVVRGIVDGVLADGDGLELIDYKTDRIAGDALASRAKDYAMQMGLYASAMARSWRRPVRRCWLVFLHPRRVVEVSTSAS